MTPSFDPAHPRTTDGLFRPVEHVLIVPQGSTIAILDLDRGVVYATTPLGTESWRSIVGGATPPHATVAEGGGGRGDGDDRHAWARMADYLFDCRIIEPAAG